MSSCSATSWRRRSIAGPGTTNGGSRRAQARRVLAQQPMPGGGEGGRERRLAERPGRAEDDRPAVHLDGCGVQRRVAAGDQAEHRGDAPQALFATDDVVASGSVTQAALGIDEKPAPRPDPQPEAAARPACRRPASGKRRRRRPFHQRLAADILLDGGRSPRPRAGGRRRPTAGSETAASSGRRTRSTFPGRGRRSLLDDDEVSLPDVVRTRTTSSSSSGGGASTRRAGGRRRRRPCAVARELPDRQADGLTPSTGRTRGGAGRRPRPRRARAPRPAGCGGSLIRTVNEPLLSVEADVPRRRSRRWPRGRRRCRA